MASYVISGNMYTTQEYAYTYEIEANSPEEAAEQFRQLVSGRGLPMDLELEQVDSPFDRSGTFNVFSEETDQDDYFDPDQHALVAYETFSEE